MRKIVPAALSICAALTVALLATNALIRTAFVTRIIYNMCMSPWFKAFQTSVGMQGTENAEHISGVLFLLLVSLVALAAAVPLYRRLKKEWS
ncbi:hypothetical protein J2D73_03500 [Acetobacter sacchari]|uniref:Uncharacterized protein n=1 Tax=Acetobacter sacchari TaxID=2661687 RepID=A0ABS3LSK1_9PROT|nr:hypothetical protein [Acetobacter sacchari]MBO1358866.1 hypothetical protein [Acetobacter sacchari]